jgi:signal transduction protein with GAF and PtsI domain
LSSSSRINDPDRISALWRTNLLDSGAERRFDQVTRLAATLLGAPSAFITLIDLDRQYHKSQHATDPKAERYPDEVPLQASFCKHVVESGEPFLVENAREHDLVRDNEAVQHGVIAYAGVPFQSGGQTLGALCVVDSQPRKWSEANLEDLKVLARSIERLISEDDPNSPDPATYGPSHGERPLLEAARKHLAALEEYRTGIQRGAATLDLDQEAKSREDVEQSAQSLAELFASSALESQEERRLVPALRGYLACEERRRKAATQFAAGTGYLPDLQAKIADELEAEDALRFAVREAGA